ncbi:MAG: cysteine--tRNA ligase [Bacteroidota bacterium]
MVSKLRVYNSLSGKKEEFQPINPPFVGMYVCGPTVYSDVHLGNVRTFVSFDVIYRYLKYVDYKVRYVRNITDVGHLENDADEGEDKISKKARLENVEPMEIAQRYENGFHEVLNQFNLLPPNIEPTATGHIIEQIEMIQSLVDNGFAYEVNGSVYFDVTKYNHNHNYGKLSKRNIEELMEGGRDLDSQDEKKNPIDFALWKNAAPQHIMRWSSPWSTGFPGWHLECSVMGTKYLGETFDIHGGGMDLKFPHHECEIAQSVGAYGKDPVKYWLHTNMLTVNGQKMSKSAGNWILPEQLFSGDHELLDESYSPMTVKFFMLQSHYSSTLDFSNDALKAASKGYKKLINGLRVLKTMEFNFDGTSASLSAGGADEAVISQVEKQIEACHSAMNDDFNTALAIGQLFNLLKKINSLHTGNLNYSDLGEELFYKLKKTYIEFVEDILGLVEEKPSGFDELVESLMEIYKQAKFKKDYEKVDEIRNALKNNGVIVKDMKTKIDWAYEE